MKRCQQCILPDSAPGATLDEKEICNFCREYKKVQYLGEDALKEHIEYAKKNGGKYECVVPLSGGRDSTYVLYLAAKKYRIPLVFWGSSQMENRLRTETDCGILLPGYFRLQQTLLRLS